MQTDERRFADLTPEEQKKLHLIRTVDDFAEVKFLRTWIEDDGFPCVALSINGVVMALPYLDTDFATDLLNPDTLKVRSALLRNLHILSANAHLDDEDEFEAEEYPDPSYGADDYGGSY